MEKYKEVRELLSLLRQLDSKKQEEILYISEGMRIVQESQKKSA